MSHRIYTPEFKDEAVRQVVERGYTVKEGCGRRWPVAVITVKWG